MPGNKRRVRESEVPVPAPEVTDEQLLHDTTRLACVAIQAADQAEGTANALSDQLAEARDELDFWRRRYMQEFATRLEIADQVCAANCCEPGERMLRRFVSCSHYVCSAYVDSDQQRRIHANGNQAEQPNTVTCPLCRTVSVLRVDPALVQHVYPAPLVVGQHNYQVSAQLENFVLNSVLDESPYVQQIMESIDQARPASVDQ